MMKNLNQIYNKYGTDKGDFENIQRSSPGHQYGDFYQPYFEKYVGKNPDILEIGVFEGASMLAHNEFFDGQCNIIGIDVYDGLKFDISKHKNISLVLGGSENQDTFNTLKDKRFDIIIDDAIHTYDNQFHNILWYPCLLKPGGIYILEDLHTNVDPRYMTNSQLGMDNSPLLTLLNYKKSDMIPDDAFDWLRRNIASMNIWVTPCESDSPTKFKQNSITAVIKFRDNG